MIATRTSATNTPSETKASVAQVSGVGVERGRSSSSAGAAQIRRDEQVDHGGRCRHRHAGMDRRHAAAADQAPDRFIGDERRPEQQQQRLRAGRQILKLLMAVAMRGIGGFVSFPHRRKRDD
ncbi:MAG TPA: hypothetical protein VLP43_06655 [Solirubrobacteraceae bacterium]|nr:hypothetical protein [Solirubrobacteraceae bacterium]